MAAKVKGVEGPTCPPQGVDGGRGGARHPSVGQAKKKAANLCHGTH